MECRSGRATFNGGAARLIMPSDCLNFGPMALELICFGHKFLSYQKN